MSHTTFELEQLRNSLCATVITSLIEQIKKDYSSQSERKRQLDESIIFLRVALQKMGQEQIRRWSS